MRLLFANLVICLVAVNPASARTAFQVYGAAGDTGATDECPVGSYFVGLVGNVGSWIDQISVVCGELKPDGSIDGSKTIASRGGGGGQFRSALCGKDEAVSGISVYRTKAYQIAIVHFTCLNVKTLASRELRIGGTGYQEFSAPMTCKNGELGAGMSIRYGKHVNGLGLICGDYRRAAAETKPTPTPVDTTAFCQNYAQAMLAKGKEYTSLGCTGWASATDNVAQLTARCRSYGAKAAETTKFNVDGLDSALASCRKKNAGGGGNPLPSEQTVRAEVTGYNKWQNPDDKNDVVCYLKANDRVTIAANANVTGELKGAQAPWVVVRGTTGECNGKVFAIYNDGKLQ